MTERALGEKKVQPAILARVAGTCARAHGTRIGQHSTGRLSGGRFPRTPFA